MERGRKRNSHERIDKTDGQIETMREQDRASAGRDRWIKEREREREFYLEKKRDRENYKNVIISRGNKSFRAQPSSNTY